MKVISAIHFQDVQGSFVPISIGVAPTASAQCPANTFVVSGGFQISGSNASGTPQPTLREEMPTGRAWSVLVIDPADAVARPRLPLGVTAYARCAQITYTTVRETSINNAGSKPKSPATIIPTPVVTSSHSVVPSPPATTLAKSSTTPTETVVAVKAGAPKTYGFTLSALGHTVYSYTTKQLSVPPGIVTFNVTNALGIGNHDFFVCSTPLTASAAKTAAIELPQTCTGTGTASLAPGDSATLTVDLTTAGTYEYLSNVGCPTFCDSGSGMIGKLQVT